jgi:hypothetical protein
MSEAAKHQLAEVLRRGAAPAAGGGGNGNGQKPLE